MKALISPLEKEEWIIDEKLFIEQLKNKYANIAIKKIEDEMRDFKYEWKIIENELFLEGLLHKSLECVIFTTNSSSFGADFAVWTRSFMPPQADIYIYDESFTDQLKLKLDTKKEEIVVIFS